MREANERRSHILSPGISGFLLCLPRQVIGDLAPETYLRRTIAGDSLRSSALTVFGRSIGVLLIHAKSSNFPTR